MVWREVLLGDWSYRLGMVVVVVVRAAGPSTCEGVIVESREGGLHGQIELGERAAGAGGLSRVAPRDAAAAAGTTAAAAATSAAATRTGSAATLNSLPC